jgi:hypothetical protein
MSDTLAKILLGTTGPRGGHHDGLLTSAAKSAARSVGSGLGRAITELGVGEALVSLLDAKGSPTMTERAWIVPPASRIGPLTDAEREAIRKASAPIYGHYEQAVDRESAYEKLKARTLSKDGGTADASAASGGASTGAGRSTPTGGAGNADMSDTLAKILLGTTGPRGGHHDGLLTSAAKSAARSVGSGLGRAILRGALGSILGGRR